MVDINITKIELQKAKEKYSKVCEKLETLNEQAFSLEQQISYLQSVIRRFAQNEKQVK
jgi:hypothetical protein